MFRVLTLNLNYYGTKAGAWSERAAVIRRTIQSAQPDLIALQAVESNTNIAGGEDQAMQLAHHLPDYAHADFRPAQPTPEFGLQGSAFLSRIPLAHVVGDLNNVPGTAAMQQFRDAGWTGAWAALRPDESGLTFDSKSPTMRIDYAWLNPALRPGLQSVEIVASEPDSGGAYASDHYGLLVTLGLDKE